MINIDTIVPHISPVTIYLQWGSLQSWCPVFSICFLETVHFTFFSWNDHCHTMVMMWSDVYYSWCITLQNYTLDRLNNRLKSEQLNSLYIMYTTTVALLLLVLTILSPPSHEKAPHRYLPLCSPEMAIYGQTNRQLMTRVFECLW